MLGGSYRFTADHLIAIVRQYEQRPVTTGTDDSDRPIKRHAAGRLPGDIKMSPLRPRPRRTARDARSTLATILNDAMPRHIQVNPAERKRGKGRKGLRRIARRERAEKVWSTPLQALLIAERCAALSGQDTDFVMVIYVAYTGSRWSEAIGLPPECVHDDQVAIDWKL
jgi:integrase